MSALPEAKKTTPRELAATILARVEQHGAYADILLDATLSANVLSDADRRLLTQLVYGALRWRGRVDWVLGQLLERPIEKLDATVRNILRVAGYELLFLDRVPVYATTNEAVKLARRHGGKGKAGLVNAILREIARRPETDWVPDDSSDEAGAIAAFVSHPEWLVGMWCARYGPRGARRLMAANNAEAPLVLRANRTKIRRDELVERLRSRGLDAVAAPLSPYAVRISRASSVAALEEFRQGLCQVQGEASQLAGCLLEVSPGMRVLDACAAPGGKATQLAELMDDRGELVATDISARGLDKLNASAARLGLTCIHAYEGDASKGLEAPASFDRVLVDAPCSGLGTLRSHPEIKWRRTRRDVQRLSRLQHRILTHSAPLVKPRGIVVYATCTLTAEENEGVVTAFLSAHPNYTLEEAEAYLPESARHLVCGPFFQALPHEHGTEGFFAAVLRRSD